jgi:hypothetical protein
LPLHKEKLEATAESPENPEIDPKFLLFPQVYNQIIVDPVSGCRDKSNNQHKDENRLPNEFQAQQFLFLPRI